MWAGGSTGSSNRVSLVAELSGGRSCTRILVVGRVLCGVFFHNLLVYFDLNRSGWAPVGAAALESDGDCSGLLVRAKSLTQAYCVICLLEESELL